MPRVWRITPEELEKLDAVRRLIADWVLEKPRERNLKMLSDLIGQNPTYMSKFIKKNNPQELPESARQILAAEMGVDEGSLRGPKSARARQHGGATAIKTAPIAAVGAHLLPELGRPIVGTDALRMHGGAAQGYAVRPPQITDREAFTIVVNGSSMEPRYFPGERLYLEPILPLAPDEDVFIQLHDDTGILRRLVAVGSSEDPFYTVRQYAGGPADGITRIPHRDVAKIAVVSLAGKGKRS